MLNTIISFMLSNFMQSIVSSIIASCVYDGSKSLFMKFWKRDDMIDIDKQLRQIFIKVVNENFRKDGIGQNIKENDYEKYKEELCKVLVKEKCTDTNSSSFKCIVDGMKKEATKHPWFYLKLFWEYFKDIRRENEQIIKELENISSKLGYIESISKSILDNLQSSKFTSPYTLPTLIAGADEVHLPEDCLPRTEIVKKIAIELQQKGLVLISGDIMVGKSVVSKLVSIHFKQDLPTFVQFDNSNILNIRNVIEAFCTNTQHTCLILDGIPQYSSELYQDLQILLEAKIAEGHKILINSRTFNFSHSQNIDFHTYALPLITVEEILEKHKDCPRKMAEFIICVSNGYPAIVNKLLIYLQNRNWSISDVEIEEFLRIPNKEDLGRLISEKIGISLEDAQSVQLLSRLTLFQNTFSQEEICAIADIVPCIPCPQSKIRDLVSKGLLNEDNGKYSLAGLVKRCWNGDLLPHEKKHCCVFVANNIIRRGSININDAIYIIKQFVSAEEYDRAGIFYIQLLEKLRQLKTKGYYEGKIISMIWMNVSLPTKMSIEIKISIRIFQAINLTLSHENYGFVLDDLRTLLELIPQKHVLKTVGFHCLALLYLQEGNSTESLKYWDAAMRGVAEGNDLVKELHSDTEQKIPLIALANVNTKVDLFSWFDYAETHSECLDFIEPECILMAFNQIIKNTSENNIEALYDEIIDHIKGKPLLAPFEVTIRARKILYLSSQKRFDEIEKIYKENKSLFDTSLGMFRLNYAYGCSLYDKGEKEKAIEYWEKGCEGFNPHKLPNTYCCCKIYCAKAYGELGVPSNAVSSIECLLNSDGVCKILTEEEMLDVHGEMAVAYWNDKNFKAALDELDIVHNYIIRHHINIDDKIKILTVKVSACVQQYFHYLKNNRYNNDMIIPCQSMFLDTDKNEKLISYYEEYRMYSYSYSLFNIASLLKLDESIAHQYVLEVVAYSAANMKKYPNLNSLMIQIIPSCLLHDEMDNVGYIVKAIASTFDFPEMEGSKANIILWMPLKLILMYRAVKKLRGEDFDDAYIQELFSFVKSYLPSSSDIETFENICLGKESQNTYSISAYANMCIQLYRYAKINTKESFSLLLYTAMEIDNTNFYADILLCDFCIYIQRYLYKTIPSGFSARYKDLNIEYDKLERMPKNMLTVKKGLRLMWAFMKDAPKLSIEQENFIE